MDREAIGSAVTDATPLATLPALREQLAAALQDPDHTYREVSETVSLDPVLAARVLRQANVGRTAVMEQVTTITQAVRNVGFGALDALLASQEVLPAPVAGARIDGRPFALLGLWQHSLATALAARAIAIQIAYAEPQEFYVAGLLHDLGKLVLQQRFPAWFDDVLTRVQAAQTTFYNVEVESDEPSHARIGRTLARSWALPVKLIEVIGYHHTPQLAVENPKIVAAVHVADALARALGLGSGGDPFVPPLNRAALHALNLAPDGVSYLLSTVEREYRTLSPRLTPPQDSHPH